MNKTSRVKPRFGDRFRRSGLLLSVAACGIAVLPLSAQAEEANSNQLSVLLRNYYLSHDYRHGERSPSGQSYREEWTQGFLLNFTSAYTPGTVGFGVDAHGFLGIKLDSGKGRAGTGLLPRGSDGRSEDSYSSAGAALKTRLSRTSLKYGEMRVATPVFATSDLRLQPEYATGFFLESQEVSGLTLNAGHFTAFKNQTDSTSRGNLAGYGVSTRFGSMDFVGGQYSFSDNISASLYASRLEDTWRQYYTNLNWNIPLAEQQSLTFDFNLYKSDDTGKSRAGKIDTTAYSFSAAYHVGRHGFLLAYQKVDGDTPFDFVGGDSIYLANSVKYADFNGPGERSWQARYDLNLHDFIPGLSFMARYVSGRNIDGTHAPQGGGYNTFDPDSGAYVPLYGRNGKHWERDLDVRYVLQSGPAKDLSFRLSHVAHRANQAEGNGNIDKLYLVIEYPLSIL